MPFKGVGWLDHSTCKCVKFKPVILDALGALPTGSDFQGGTAWGKIARTASEIYDRPSRRFCPPYGVAGNTPIRSCTSAGTW